MGKVYLLGGMSKVVDSCFKNTRSLYTGVGNNTGNLAFQNAIHSHLPGKINRVGWASDQSEISSMGDIGVIPAANQLGAHTNYAHFAKILSGVSSNLVMLGLGAQSGIAGNIPKVSAGTLDWVREVAKRGRGEANIGVRGTFTQKVLHNYGLSQYSEVLGCPSLFTNPDPELGLSIAKKGTKFKRIAVVAGHPKWSHLARIEASLAAMVSSTDGIYVGQHPLEMVELTRGEAINLSIDSLNELRNYSCPHMDSEEFIQWSEKYGRVFFDVSSWMESYRRFDFVIGTRIHGVVLALQAGVPALCIAHDSRTIELCETLKVPYVLSSDVSRGVSRDDLAAIYKFDPKEFDSNRSALANRYISFLSKNELNYVSWLDGIARRQ